MRNITPWWETQSRNKYNAKAIIIDGIRFPSHAQGARYRTLRLMERAGEIANLNPQPKSYPLVVNGVKIGRYTPDFEYDEGGAHVVEEYKSRGTVKARDYRLRKLLMLACHGIKIREVGL